jgi:signal peptidase II
VPAANDLALVATVAAVVVGVDQLTKSIVVDAIGPGSDSSRRTIGGDWIALEYTENRGAAFGLFSGLAPVLALLSAVILIGVAVHFLRTPNPSVVEVLCIGAIVGGALGNLIDRVRLGYVIDFVAIGAWPNFNLADSAITLGVLGLAWGRLRDDRVGQQSRVRGD